MVKPLRNTDEERRCHPVTLIAPVSGCPPFAQRRRQGTRRMPQLLYHYTGINVYWYILIRVRLYKTKWRGDRRHVR